MSDVRLTRDLTLDGYTSNQLARQRRSGELVHLRRGAYATAVADTGPLWEQRERQHRLLIEATVRLLGRQAVVSHGSAALLHGLPVFTNGLGRVQLTRSASPGGKNRGHISMHTAPLHESEVVVVEGMLATSLARTVVDVARSSTFDEAVVCGDAALRIGLTADDLETCLGRSRRRPGMGNARRMAAFIDARSESPGESRSRVSLRAAGLPTPTLQYEVFTRAGVLLGRSDFCWEEQRTLGEFDGRVKYGRLLRPGESSEEVVYREKLREDAFRDDGWEVARWVSADLDVPGRIADRVRRAFLRNGRHMVA